MSKNDEENNNHFDEIQSDNSLKENKKNIFLKIVEWCKRKLFAPYVLLFFFIVLVSFIFIIIGINLKDKKENISNKQISIPEQCKEKGLHYIGEMNKPRVFHKIKKQNGKILLTGGYNKIIRKEDDIVFGYFDDKDEFDLRKYNATSEKTCEEFSLADYKFTNTKQIKNATSIEKEIYKNYLNIKETTILVNYKKYPYSISQTKINDKYTLLYNRIYNACFARNMNINIYDNVTKKFINFNTLKLMGKHYNFIFSHPLVFNNNKILFLGGIQYKMCDNISQCLNPVGEKYYCPSQIYDINKNKVIKTLNFAYTDVLLPIETMKLSDENLLIIERNQIRQMFNAKKMKFEPLKDKITLNVFLPSIVSLNDNQILITGGIDEKSGNISSSAWIYTY